jgi:hypothetical protein
MITNMITRVSSIVRFSTKAVRPRSELLARLTPEQRAALASRAEKPPGKRVSGSSVPRAAPAREGTHHIYADVDDRPDGVLIPVDAEAEEATNK